MHHDIDIKELYGRKLAATDGDIGHVRDFYFDDQSWALRYLVADTGSWLLGRDVLLSPHAFGVQVFEMASVDDHRLRVNLTRKQIEASPSIDSHAPVSRQYEEEYYRYYGWPEYWTDSATGGLAAFTSFSAPALPENRNHHGHNQRDDLHLRSTKAAAGYSIQATDGPIGSLNSFILNLRTWTIRDLVVEAGHWFAGKTILLRPADVVRISYEDSSIFVNLTKETIAHTAKGHVAHAGTGQA